MPEPYQVLSSHERYASRMFRVLDDEVSMPGGGSAHRQYLVHVGAVGVVALDDAGRVVLVRQYRHAVRRYLWELPAGLRDSKAEDLAATARRELAEETDLTAAHWDLLVDLHTTPGCSDELIRLYLARGLAAVPAADRHARTDEEADLEVAWFPLDEAVAMIFAGQITNAACVAGLLAARHKL